MHESFALTVPLGLAWLCLAWLGLAWLTCMYVCMYVCMYIYIYVLHAYLLFVFLRMLVSIVLLMF